MSAARTSSTYADYHADEARAAMNPDSIYERMLALQAAVDALVAEDAANPFGRIMPVADIEEQVRGFEAWIAIRKLATGAKA
jgi:hypothetical protein